MNVSDKTIVVTGGGSGLGRELVFGLLRRGARVAALDINDKGLAETVKLSGAGSDKIATFKIDITNKKDVEALPKKIAGKLGPVDGLINNAGIIQPFIKINDLTYDAIERVMKINFFGALYMIKAFLPGLLTRPEGHIVNISSMGGFLPVPGQSIYGASKAALKLMTEGLYSELKDTNVRVTIVFPGAMQTNITVNSGVSIPSADSSQKSSMKALPAPKAAEMVLKGMEKNEFRVLVGPDASMLDFLYRLSPKFATNFIFKQMKSLLSR